MDGEISIAEVLAAMDSGEAFELVWVRATKGKNGEKGDLKRINARKGTRTSKGKSRSNAISNTQSFKNRNQVPLIDLKTREMNTPKITHLIEFNGRRIRHWTGR